MRALLLCLAALLIAASPVTGLPSQQQPWRHSPSHPLTFPSTPSTSSPTSPSPNPISLTVPPFSPLANPSAIVHAGNARFTLLTSRLIRLEWSATRTFQDAATWVAIQRNHTVPPYKTSTNATHTRIDTGAVLIEYLTASTTSFNSRNIRVTVTYTTSSPSPSPSPFPSPSSTSPPSQPTPHTVTWSAINHEEVQGNLYGTFRTLDGDSTDETNFLDCATSGRTDQHCTYGVVSRNGYALIDDTHTPAFDDSPWPWIQPRQWAAPPAAQCQLADADKRDCGFVGISATQCRQKGCCWTGGGEDGGQDGGEDGGEDSEEAQAGVPSCFYDTQADQDLYVLGHGHDYKAAIKEFTQLSGDIPLPPRYTFGVFFSRYWASAAPATHSATALHCTAR